VPGERTPWYVPIDPGGRHRCLQRVRLEPLLEEVGRAHRHELDEDRLLVLWELLEGAGEAGDREEIAQVVAGEVGRYHREDRLDEASHLDHQPAVLLVRLGVGRRPAADLAHRAAVVVDAPEEVTVERGEGAV
jgi:hypothetical protein